MWNGKDVGDWASEIDGADAVINLAGRSVNCRYHAANRREILESRIDSTRGVGRAIAQASRPPKLWMNASTATIYRHALDRPMDEKTGELGGSEPGAPEKWRFSIDVATQWERAFFDAAAPQAGAANPSAWGPRGQDDGTRETSGCQKTQCGRWTAAMSTAL